MIIVLLIVIAVFFFLLHYGHKLAFYYIDPQDSPYAYEDSDQTRACKAVFDAAIADFEKEPCEEVSIKSNDGLTLYGRYYHVKDNAPVEIMCHGYKGNVQCLEYFGKFYEDGGKPFRPLEFDTKFVDIQKN